MTRVLHTIWIRIVESIMYANRIRKMINIELGNEIKKHVFPSFITVIRAQLSSAQLSIIYCLGGRRIFGKGGGGHMVLSWNREGSAVAKRVRTA